jgi:hypothetical protein
MRARTLLIALSTFLFGPAAPVSADGGTVRLSELRGSYRITVFTAPTPLRAGNVDVSVLVQNADSGELADGVQVSIRAQALQGPQRAIEAAASHAKATNRLYQAAQLDLSEPGRWRIDVVIEGPRESVTTGFDVEAETRSSAWSTVVPWIAWPLGVVALFIAHQVLVRRRLARSP